MDLNKVPRWALVLFAFAGLGACGILVSTARADLDKFKTIAIEARSVSSSNTQSISEIKDSLRDMKKSNSIFLEKYDRNQEENQRVFRQILAAVKS